MKQFGPYALLARAGSGGMAEVWLAEKQALGARKRLAVKLIATQHVGNASFVNMFLAEARMSMELGHSSIVQVHEVGEIDGRYYMAMEWIHGLNLAELTNHVWASGTRISPRVAGYVIGEVLRALDFSHKRDVIHRDVSPQNVMISTAGEVKLMDFGIARLTSEETSGVNIKGKLRYMPPEQVRGQSHMPSVDLYAVGAMLHELAASERFRGLAEQVQLLNMALHNEVPELNAPADWPDVLEQLRRGLLRLPGGPAITSARDGVRLLEEWSGYRNASYELGEMVAQFVPEDLAAHSHPSNGAFAANVETEPMRGGDTEQVAPTQVLTQVLVNEHSESGPREQSRRRTYTLLILVCLVASMLCLTIGVYGFGEMAGWWAHPGEHDADGRGDPTPSVASAAPSAVDPSTPPTPADPVTDDESTPTVAVVEVQPPPIEPEQTSAPKAGARKPKSDKKQPASNDDNAGWEVPAASVDDDAGWEVPPNQGSPSAETQPQPAATGTAAVSFVASPYFYLQLRIDKKKVYELDPGYRGGNIKLTSGTHRLEIRQEPSEDWTQMGTIEVQAGKRYKVKMTSPPTVTEL